MARTESDTLHATPLPAATRVAVIGGGIMGCSMIYHLVQAGWRDVVLLEKAQLTAGSTWHAAGMIPTFSKTSLITGIINESLKIYRSFVDDPNYPVDLHRCGNIRLARSTDEMLENRRFLGIARILDMEAEIVDPKRIRELYPLLNTAGIVGGLWLPGDSYTDPAQTTQAFARAARKSGATICERTKVIGIDRKPDGNWTVTTNRGVMDAEIIVNCGGMWAKEISALVGGILPAVSIEHSYLVTEGIPEIRQLTRELPMIHDLNVPMYTMADRDGLFVSCYEDHPKFFGTDGVPGEFEHQLLPADLERTEHKLAAIMEMIPSLKSVGIRTVINGPTPRSADMAPLVGPAHGFPNFYVLCGVYGGFGFTSLSRNLAEWLVEGEASINMAALDVRRLGEYATKEYAVRRLSTGHAFEAPVYFPHAEHLAARPVWTTPLFSTLREKGAVFGAKDGWEVPNWFAPKGIEPVDRPTYRRANWFDHVGDEYRAVSEAVGVIDSSCLAKFDVSGPGAESFLDRMVANIMPIAGGLRVCPVLNEAGHVIALWLVGKYQENGFYVTAASNCTGRDYDLLRWNAPSDVSVTDISNRTGVLTVAGPYGSQLLKNLGLESRIPMCFGVSQLWIEWIPVRILRLNWGKVPVWEIHTAMEYLVGLYDMVLGAGKNLGVVDFGMRAMQSMRLESGLPAIGIDIQPRCSPKRSLLKRYVALSKRAFVGRDALDVEEAAQGRRLSRLAVDPLESSDHHPWGDEPILIDDRDVGVVTSAFFGYGAGCPVGFGYIDCDVSISDKLSIQVLGKKVSIELFDDGLDMPGVIAS